MNCGESFSHSYAKDTMIYNCIPVTYSWIIQECKNITDLKTGWFKSLNQIIQKLEKIKKGIEMKGFIHVSNVSKPKLSDFMLLPFLQSFVFLTVRCSPNKEKRFLCQLASWAVVNN